MFIVKYVNLCGYVEDLMLVENSIVFVFVIKNVLKEREISFLLNFELRICF